MIAIPGEVSKETISAIIGDEMAIGVVNHKPWGADNTSSGKEARR